MKESQVHQAFCKWLDMMGMTYGHDRTDKRTSTIKGEPDFRIYHAGRVLLIEIKVMGGKLSPDQEKRHVCLRVNGCPVLTLYSLQDCVDAVKAWLEDIKRATAVPGPLQGHPSRPLDVHGVSSSNGKGKVDVL